MNTKQSSSISEAIKVIREGGVILYKSDTIWGIGCDARNSDAVERIFKIKQREDSKALITLVAFESDLQSLVPDITDVAWDIIEFSERPLTVIFDQVKGLSEKAIASDGSAAIRKVKEGTQCFNLLQQVNCPMISTSANISGESFDGTFEGVTTVIKESVDFILLNDSEKEQSQASKIIKLGNDGTFKLIRD